MWNDAWFSYIDWYYINFFQMNQIIYIVSLGYALGLLPISYLIIHPDKPDRNLSETTIIDFSKTISSSWQIVNDGVMGGVSRSSFKPHEDGYAVFSGILSLKNNGGFASVRAQSRQAADLSAFDGLAIQAMGDGKVYCIRLRTIQNGRGTWYTYEARFQTTAGEWGTYLVPYSAFKPEFRGSRLRGVPNLNPNAIIEIGFMIQDKQEGDFRLAIKELNGFKN
jgi:monofunctional biosynthetic peptidoglycan transglycosylase